MWTSGALGVRLPGIAAPLGDRDTEGIGDGRRPFDHGGCRSDATPHGGHSCLAEDGQAKSNHGKW